MKKILALIVTAAILISCVPAMAASETENILATAKSRIGSTEKYDEFDSSNWTNENGETVYNFYWYKNGENYESLNVSINKDGFVSYYDHYEDKYVDGKPSINNLDINKLYESACKFAKQINPSYDGKIKVMPKKNIESLNENSVSFDLRRFENGIEVEGDNGYISVSNDGTQLNSYTMNFSNGIKFDSSDKIITKEEAQKAYAENIGMDLIYDYRYKGDEKVIFPAYIANEKYLNYIDAKTGKLVTLKDIDYDMMYGMGEESMAVNDMKEAEEDFTDAEISEIEAIEGTISKEDAEKLIRENKILLVPSNYKVKKVSLNSFDDKCEYVFNFTTKTRNDYIIVRLDTKSGKILSFNKEKRGSKGKISDDKAKTIAENAVKVLEADTQKEYELFEDDYDKETYNFIRKVNGIYFSGDTIYVTIDKTNGDIVGYNNYGYGEFEDADFPELDNIITKEEALQILFERNELKPYYVLNCSKEHMQKHDKATLVYKFNNETVLTEFNAITGEAAWDFNNDKEYTDIEGHYAENAIKTLKNYTIGYYESEFKPSQEITQKEFLAFVVNVIKESSNILIDENYDYEYDLRQAVRFGLVKDGESTPDVAITREFASLILARAMGFDEIANIENIFNCPFKDVTNNVGQITILSGLKIINGDGMGNFNPQKTLTRGDFAIILFNYLSK